jgi:uncharacterized membrane protein HdeD (DUF308 family)
MSQDADLRGEKIQAAASRVRSGLTNKLTHVRRALLTKAALIAIGGVCIIIWPQASAKYLLWAIAALFIVDGIASVSSLFKTGERGGYFFQGLISLAVGAILFLWPGATLSTLALVLGVWAILNSITLLMALQNLDQGTPARSAQRIAAIVLAVVGIVLLFWPGLAAVTLSWLIGIGALIVAAVLFWLSQRMDDVNKKLNG